MTEETAEYLEESVQPEITWWPGISAGLPVLVFGLAFLVQNLVGFGRQPWLLFGADLIVLIGMALGWLAWFPSWAFAFTGMALVFSLWWSSYSLGSAGWLAGGLAWSPVLVALALGLVLSRSVRPFLKFLQGVMRDWSLASLALYSVLPVAMYAAMTVMPPANAVLFQALAVLVMAIGAGFAGLTNRPGARGRLLLLGLSWSWFIVTIGVGIYWRGHATGGEGLTVSWFDQVLGMSLIWLILAIIVFFPAGVAMLGRLARRAAGSGRGPV